MRVTGKIALLTFILSVASLLCGSYVKGSPALFEPKYEQTTEEACLEVKTDEKKEFQSFPFFDLDDDFTGAPILNISPCYTYHYTNSSTCTLQKHAFASVPRYLLFCNLKLHFC